MRHVLEIGGWHTKSAEEAHHAGRVGLEDAREVHLVGRASCAASDLTPRHCRGAVHKGYVDVARLDCRSKGDSGADFPA